MRAEGNGQTVFESRSEKNLSPKGTKKSSEKKRGRKSLKEIGDDGTMRKDA
jgi:hypothetical protein